MYHDHLQSQIFYLSVGIVSYLELVGCRSAGVVETVHSDSCFLLFHIQCTTFQAVSFLFSSQTSVSFPNNLLMLLIQTAVLKTEHGYSNYFHYCFFFFFSSFWRGDILCLSNRSPNCVILSLCCCLIELGGRSACWYALLRQDFYFANSKGFLSFLTS